ncbi:MAG: OmpH family outer membrane protein [Spirochaetota bacterium]
MQAKLKTAILISLVFLLGPGLFGQQITRIAVVDLGKVIVGYSRDSSALRDYEAKKTQIQQEINGMAEEIKALQSQKADAEKSRDAPASTRLEGEIAKKTDTLRAYVRAKQDELDREASKLNSSNAFVQLIYQKIQLVAETEGYSLVLNLKSADAVMSAVLWYSPMIDITDKVIASLIGKAQ